MVIIGAGCSVTRGLKDNQAIVRKVTIKGVDKEFADESLNYIDKEQQPNNWLNLQFYYLFSQKGKRKIGEAPALLDSNLVEFSRLQIQKFLINKGFLKAKVVDSIIIKKKKAQLIFTAAEGPLFKVRNFRDSIPDEKVRALYKKTRKQYSHVNKGSRFDTDSLAYDRDQFYQVMKRNGYFDFYRQYINYLPDSSFNNSVVDVVMTIDNPGGKTEHPIYTINNTLITIARSNGRTTDKADTIQVDSQFRFVDFSGKFKPRTATDYVFQRKGEIYDLDKQTLTTTRLSELNVFRNVPNPTYEKSSDSTNRLNSKIDIVPLKRMTDRVEAEFLFNQGRFGYNLGNTFTNRNIFKQAAILQIKINWSILFDNGNSSVNDGIQNQDFRAGVSVIYPRLLLPFKFPNLAKFGVPHTTFSTNYQLFYQKGLVERKSFINSVTYDFFETARKQHSITPINIEFSSGNIDPTAREELLKQNRYSYVYLISRKTFTLGSQYTFQYNAQELNSYKNFIYFRGGLDLGGGLLSLAAKAFNAPKDSLGQRSIFGFNYSQYVKTEIDYRWYRSLGGEKQFIFRFNSGIGIPYGNSNQLIFEKNFYAGGANDIRAWLPRTLGPGQFNRASYGANGDTTRARLKYLDQFGEIKMVANLEYRYKLVDNFFGSKLKGAMFIDAGNVWRLHKTTDNPNGEFRFNNILQSTAIGIGTGLRFDLGFFIFRLDAAFKFKDPQFSGGDQWVFVKHFGEVFGNGDFKEAYLRNNKTGIDANGKVVGDGYSFMQLNFGIGLPF